jgi:Rrf2 family protein
MRPDSRLTVAVHALLLLDDAGAERLTSGDIAHSVNTNPVVIRRLLGRLMEAGLVAGAKGPTGGYRLARPSTEITIWDIYQTMREEGPFGLHARAPNPRCPVGRHIQAGLEDLYGAAESAMKTVLGHVTLRGLRKKLAAAQA